jgi:hypothetical protein
VTTRSESERNWLYPQVGAGNTGFDSRQLHRESAGQSHKSWPVFFHVSSPVDISRDDPRSRLRAHGVSPHPEPTDGSADYAVLLYRLDGKQTSTSFEDIASATKFKNLTDRFGPAKPLEIVGADTPPQTMTVGQSRTWSPRPGVCSSGRRNHRERRLRA